MFLKNRNISSKIKRSKVTDYAALNKLNLKFEFKAIASLDLDLLCSFCWKLVQFACNIQKKIIVWDFLLLQNIGNFYTQFYEV